jgi:glycosyltransferase involved in cell wall biosynthesis
MSVGTPVIATGRGGSAEYLDAGRNCLLFDPDEAPEALADAIRALADDQPLRSRLREGGLATSASIPAENFNLGVEAVLAKAVERNVARVSDSHDTYL